MGMNSIARSGGPQDEGCVRTTGYGGYAFFHILCFSITTSSSLQPTVMRVLCSVDEHVLLGYWIFITVTLDYWIQEMYIAIVEFKKFSGFAVLICRKNYWACMYKIYMCLSHTKRELLLKKTSFSSLRTLSLVKFSTITVLCMRRWIEKGCHAHMNLPPVKTQKKKIIEKNRVRPTGYWITGLLLYWE